jgi:hypothetical protein
VRGRGEGKGGAALSSIAFKAILLLLTHPNHTHHAPPPGFVKRAPNSKAALAPPTLAITCPHGRLIPETAASTTKRLAVPRPLWRLLRQIWEQARAAAGGAGGGGGGGKGRAGGDANKAARAKARQVEAAQKAAVTAAGGGGGGAGTPVKEVAAKPGGQNVL